MTNKFKSWYTSDIRFIRENISLMTDQQFADHFNRTLKGIKALRKRMKIYRDDDGRFKPGSEPANKGKPFQAGGRSKDTQFKKGNQPHNTKHDYAVSTRVDRTGRTYLWIRIGTAKWVQLHRYIWELSFGPIPKNMICVFKDGNTSNINPENLELITRKENVIRNHNRVKASTTMKRHWNYCCRKEHAGLITSRHKQLTKKGLIQ